MLFKCFQAHFHWQRKIQNAAGFVDQSWRKTLHNSSLSEVELMLNYCLHQAPTNFVAMSRFGFCILDNKNLVYVNFFFWKKITLTEYL